MPPSSSPGLSSLPSQGVPSQGESEEDREKAVLRMQNERFKEVIKQMTSEMEMLANNQKQV
jgi:hypothetical protein